MNRRQQVLKALRATQVPDVALPALDHQWTTYADPPAQFAQVLEAVGGFAIDVAGDASLTAALEQLEAFQQASRVWSLVPAIESKGGDWQQLSDPHDFESLDCCLIPGEFAVAENGAVWLTQKSIPHRVALFITQHLILVVPRREIVNNMHEAYQRISLEEAPFGIFISGPSKTADIEQSLVIGAHGARSMTVLLVGDSP